MLQRFFSVLVV